MCEYGTLKPVEVILRRGRGKKKSNGGDEQNRGTFMHVWKRHTEIPEQLLYTNKNIKIFKNVKWLFYL
jgi:hypothetical protein